MADFWGGCTYFGLLVKFMSAGRSRVSSTSTMSTSPDCISAVPSHDIIIGIQSDPVEQFSGVCNVIGKNIRI